MDGRHENIDDLERIGSPIGSTPLNEDNNQLIFERKTKTIRQEDHSLTSRLPDATQPTINVMDPIQRLPPEISTVFIQHILPLDGNYSAQLLDLTSVSPIWLSFLLTTPVLWSEIYLDDRQHDFLAMVAIFIHFSSEVALKVAIYDRPMDCWAGLSSIFAPVRDRITSLTVLETKLQYQYDSEGIILAISNFFDHLGHPSQLQELAFVDQAKPTISAFDSLDLFSTIRLSGTLTVPMPPSAQSSATPGRFFDINKYNSFGPTPLAAPLFRSCALALRWFSDKNETTVHMREDVLSQLKLSSKYVYRHIFLSDGIDLLNSNFNSASATKLAVDAATAEISLERFTHIIGTSLCHLSVGVALSQVDDLANFLRLLTRLERLNLQIKASGLESTTEIAPSSVVVPQLRRLLVIFEDELNYRLQTVVEALQGLFSVLTHLYPGVELLTLWIDTWPFFASSYMESLRRLKYLSLSPRNYGTVPRYDSQGGTETGSITLHSLEELKVEGYPRIRGIRTPNLLSLTLEPFAPIVDLEHLDISSLRKLTIHLMEEGSYALNPLDYPVLSELDLSQDEAFKRVDILSFSSLSSIRLSLMTQHFTNPEGNHLCTELLCNPEGCPSLQELHFDACLEWDVLFLMLERRNFGLDGVRRIHTVTLPFIPFPLHQTFTHLLTGEKAARPPLESISLEATREVLFDPNVPGCCFCLKNMVPACVKKVRDISSVDDFDLRSPGDPNKLYPDHSYQGDAVPGDILDWMDHRKRLVDVWKSSCEEFHLKYTREEMCYRDPYYG